MIAETYIQHKPFRIILFDVAGTRTKTLHIGEQYEKSTNGVMGTAFDRRGEGYAGGAGRQAWHEYVPGGTAVDKA